MAMGEIYGELLALPEKIIAPVNSFVDQEIAMWQQYYDTEKAQQTNDVLNTVRYEQPEWVQPSVIEPADTLRRETNLATLSLQDQLEYQGAEHGIRLLDLSGRVNDWADQEALQWQTWNTRYDWGTSEARMWEQYYDEVMRMVNEDLTVIKEDQSRNFWDILDVLTGWEDLFGNLGIFLEWIFWVKDTLSEAIEYLGSEAE